MSTRPGRDQERVRERFTRSEQPLWRQAFEGIGLVVVFAAVVVAVGGALALLVSLLF